MTKTSGQENGVVGAMLAALESELADTAEALGQALLDLKRQEKGGIAVFKDRIAQLREAIVIFNQERARLEKLLRSENSDRLDGTVDLVRARHVVERGLSRLGPAEDAKTVS